VGVFGSGAFVGYLSRLLYGPATTFDHVEVTNHVDGTKSFQVFIRKDTTRTAWHGSRDTISRSNRAYGSKLVPLERYEDALHSDSYFIVPLNRNGHVVLKHGVYDLKNRRIIQDKHTDITNYGVIKQGLKHRAKMIITSPNILARLLIVLAISAMIDTGVYEIGKYRGYRAAEKGKLPLKLLNGHKEKHQPSEALMIANNFSPIPLTLEPLNPSATSNIYVHPTKQQLQQLQATSAQWAQQSAPQQPFIA